MYRYYVLGLLTVVYILNFLDRQILSILLPPIKAEFALSDTQLGILTGPAFAIFYTVFAIPMAAWADRGTRRTIIAFALTAWSAMTAACGLAANYAQLLAARIGVAIGESGGGPPSQSLISDYFAPHERATAMSVYYLGLPFGVLFGLVAGGYIAETFGWREAFFAVGLPGIAVALLVRFTLREPVRGQSEGLKVGSRPPLKETFAYLYRCKSYGHMVFGSALHAFVGYGLASWLPSFLVRSHGMSLLEISLWLGLIAGIGGGIGTLLGGYLADRLSVRDKRWPLWLPMLGMAGAVPFLFATFLVADPHVALIIYFVPAVLNSFWSGPVHASIQSVVQVRMRAMAAAGLLFIVNLIGLGLGPLLIGILSDALEPRFGVESLRYALMSVFGFKIWCAWHYWRGSKTLVADLDDARTAAAAVGSE